MKRISFITFCLAAVALTAAAQVVPHYGEVFNESTNQLMSKQWVSAAGHYRQEVTDQSGTFINIFRRDSMTIYRLNPSNKTYMAISFSQVASPNSMFGMKIEESANTKTEFIGQEEVEGKMCDHYRHTTVTRLAGGQSETTIYDQWIYKPLNTWIRQTVGAYGSNREVLRNIRQGAQPAQLFEIPKDYKAMSLPGGGLMEALLGGKSPAENQQKADDFQQGRQEATKELNETFDPKKSQEQQIQDALKLLEGLKKK
jgi:hypothetical protein